MPSFESSLQNFDKFTRRCTHQSRTASETNLRGNVFSAFAVVVLHPSFCFSHMKKSALRPQLGGSDGARSYEVGEKRR